MGIGESLEKLQRRREIQNKIADLRGEIGKKEMIRFSFEQYQTRISEELENWDMKYEEYMGIDLGPDIKVIDSFEGMAAEQLVLDFLPVVTEINDIAGKMSEVLSGIADQISKIDTYIEKLNVEIAELLCQLEAI